MWNLLILNICSINKAPYGQNDVYKVSISALSVKMEDWNQPKHPPIRTMKSHTYTGPHAAGKKSVDARRAPCRDATPPGRSINKWGKAESAVAFYHVCKKWTQKTTHKTLLERGPGQRFVTLCPFVTFEYAPI